MNIKSFINIFKKHCLNNNFEKSSFQKDLVISYQNLPVILIINHRGLKDF